MSRLVLKYEILDLTRSVGSCILVLKNVFLKIQLGKNSFEMLKLPCSGDRDADSPLYLEQNKITFNLSDVKIMSLTCVYTDITGYV